MEESVMLFNEFGSKENPTLLIMHGMLQDWHSEYEALAPLASDYRLIVPAMDGFYDGCPEFTSFADQCRQIEEFVHENYGGTLHGAYGASQGGLMLVELMTRNRIRIDTVILDGVYVAHQGAIAGWCTCKMFQSIKKNNGKLPKALDYMLDRMGTSKEMMTGMLDWMYWDVSDYSMKRNMMENYTYRTRPEIRNTESMVHLWCGSKEPYALKSHKILKKYLRHYDERVLAGLGHGEMLCFHPEELCEMIRNVL